VYVHRVTETYSTYEAKAKLSEILRKVESGRTIHISRRGQTIAEIRPLRQGPTGLAQRIIELSQQGALTSPSGDPGNLQPVARRPGALHRFLSDRGA
jgi:antitoxin (DNA-binding transcriptional repressor) of toxin-antitoxin stability system